VVNEVATHASSGKILPTPLTGSVVDWLQHDNKVKPL